MSRLLERSISKVIIFNINLMREEENENLDSEMDVGMSKTKRNILHSSEVHRWI